MASINDFFQVFLFNASVIVQLKRKLFHRFQHFSSCFFFCFSCAQHLQSIKKQIVNYLVCVTICLICESEYWMGKSSPLTHSVFLKSIQCWDLFSVFFFSLEVLCDWVRFDEMIKNRQKFTIFKNKITESNFWRKKNQINFHYENSSSFFFAIFCPLEIVRFIQK